MATNCVRVWLPSGPLGGAPRGAGDAAKMLAVRRELEGFGDIKQVDMQGAGKEQILQVTYFDIRSAARAMQNWSDRCEYGPQDGSRTASLKQDAVHAVSSADVSDISQRGDGEFGVEFFDTRAASRAAEVAKFAEYAGLCPSVLKFKHPSADFSDASTLYPSSASLVSDGDSSSHAEELSEDSVSERGSLDRMPLNVALPAPRSAQASGSAGPRHVHSFRMTELRWGDLSSNQERRTDLRLRGLPRHLCDARQLEAFLAARGLQDAVASVRVTARSASVGVAAVTAASVEDVPRLAKFFHGAQLGGSTPVAVSFAPTAPKQAPPPGLPSPAKLDEPLRVLASAQAQGSSCSSEQRQQSDLAFQRSLSPPPGLEFMRR